MKIGSLVVLVNDIWKDYDSEEGVTYPIKDVIYTVRNIAPSRDGLFGLFLEEIVNPIYEYKDGRSEACFLSNRFREVQPPMKVDISELQHQTKTEIA